MIDFDFQDYRNFIFGVVPKNHLARHKRFVFTLWGEELIFFWNDGDVRCYKNICNHLAFSLSEGKLSDGHITCQFHGWKYELSDGALVHAPYTKKLPRCRLNRYRAFVKNGIVFVYAGDDEYFENAKNFIFEDIAEDQASVEVEYEVPFYLALNASMDYAHFAHHKFFYPIYSIYRWTFFEKNTMLTTFTPIMIEETEAYFRYKIVETDCEVTVYPFCIQVRDLLSKNEWQIFVVPISKTKTRYIHTLKSHSKNKLFNMFSYLFFNVVNRYSAIPDDKKWLKTMYNNIKAGNKHRLCDHDFALKKYLGKFMVRKNIDHGLRS